MKPDYTHVSVILDRSGSMQSVRSDVIGGFNTFLAEQKSVLGDCTLTLVQFDGQDPYEVLRDFVPIQSVAPLGDEYLPRASTPLYDAVGRGIVETGNRLAARREEERPEKVVFVIITDGLENASREYDRHKVLQMIQHQRDKYAWEFVFLGANQDALAEGEKIGIAGTHACTYGQDKTAGMMRELAQNVGEYRRGKARDMAWKEKQRQDLK